MRCLVFVLLAGCGARSVELLDDARVDASCTLVDAVEAPANLLFVLDRSSSMNQRIDGATRWEIVQDELRALVDNHASQLRFGLMLYPGVDRACNAGAACQAGHVFLDVDVATTATQIDEVLAESRRCTNYGTPTAETLDQLVTYPPFADPAVASSVLLVTDGRSSCKNPEASAAQLRETVRVRTHVVGFGNNVDAAQLAATASAGGTGLPHHAADRATLRAAFADFARSARSCTYEVTDTRELAVMLDGERIDSWELVGDRIVITGEACDAIRSGEPALEVRASCPSSPIVELRP